MKKGSAPERRAQAPMTSAVNWALLGLIIERPSYAYELAHRFDRIYDGVLSLSSVSHVYVALDALKGRSLIEEVPGSGTGRQPKPHYRATGTGSEEYRARLVEQASEDRRRERLFAVQLAALTRAPQSALEVLAGCEACLEPAGWIPIPIPNSKRNQNGAPGHDVSEVTERLMSEENRLAVAAKRQWLQYAREELEALANGQARDAPAQARRQALPERATRTRRAA
ncbi:MAG TPA: helix-turn-helix transcriptional regulator [Solirubrobacteraceae bacterium]|nr:helix-turn-helix transcriptional regulator [Solirubrobacteraceae bacterium]